MANRLSVALAVAILLTAPHAADGHGMMLEPVSRNARDGILTSGGSMWFSQGCSITCKICNQTAPIPTTAGNLCPDDPSGIKGPIITDPKLTTWNREGIVNGVAWTALHPWRAPGHVPGIDPCGVAGGSLTNHSYPAGGFGPETGYPQGFPGSKLPVIEKSERAVWKAGGTANVTWTPVANHGGGYHYSICPASEELTEECFNKFPLGYVHDTTILRYLFVNDTTNRTEVTIQANRVSKGTYPVGSTWTKNPIPCGTKIEGYINGAGGANGYPPQFPPPEGCDENCWGYQPCNYGWTHPSWEGWNKTLHTLPGCAPAEGKGCCHTMAYMLIIDEVTVPNVPPGDYVVRWRWDAEQSAQIWSGCGDITITA